MRLLALALVLALAGCAQPAVPVGTLPAPLTTSTPTSTPTTARVPATAPAALRVTKVLVVIEENHEQVDALAHMPFLDSQARQYGYATRYDALTHPSLPNYLGIAGGATFGVTNDGPPSEHKVPGRSVFDAALAAGRTARTYAESMPSPCSLVSSGQYAVKHNPWAYFSDPASRSACRRDDVSTASLPHDIDSGALPTVGLLVPNLCHDAHDCSLGTADSWLKPWLRALERGPDWQAGRLAIVVTFDENDGHTPNRVLTAVLHPRLQHVVVSTPLNHYSLTRWLAEVAGASPLRGGAAATSLGTAFGA